MACCEYICARGIIFPISDESRSFGTRGSFLHPEDRNTLLCFSGWRPLARAAKPQQNLWYRVGSFTIFIELQSNYMYYILLDYIFKTIHSEHLPLCAHRWHMKTWHIHIHDRSGLVWIIWLSHNKTNYKSLWSCCLIDANFVCIMVNTTALYQKMLKNWKFRKNLHNLSIRLHILCKMCHLQIEKFDVTVKEVADSNWEYYKTNFVHWKGEETCWKCCSRRIWYTGVRSIV